MSRLPEPGRAIPAERLGEAFLLAGPVLAVDVFDTLVERLVRPEHVKILACDRLVQRLGLDGACGPSLYARRQRIESALGRRAFSETGEAEIRHADVARELFEELHGARLVPAHVDADGFMAAALQVELVVERQVLRAKPGAIAALEAARSAGKRVILISDFYLPGPELAGLLAAAGIAPPLYEALHVSCDRMASKRSGRLFDLVLADAALAPEDVTMFGDNPHSDVAMATARGLRAVLVEDGARVAFYASNAADVCQARRLEQQVLALVEAPDAPVTHLRHAVPALLLFTERLYRAARGQGLRRLFFLAREGQLLQRMFDAYQDALGEDGDGRIETHYLLVSRRACYAASLAPLEEEQFLGLFAHYRRISLRDFCNSLGLPPAETERLAASLGCDPDAVQPDFPTSDVFAALRADPEFAALYEAHRKRRCENLRGYLTGFGVDLRREPLAVVDCGWKGSIQDFLRGALPPEVAVQGFYIGLIDVGQDVSAKAGLLMSTVGGLSPHYLVFAENRSLFEVLLCADHGSAIGYERGPDGLFRALLDDDPVERRIVEETMLPVARDAEQVFRTLATARAMSAISPAAWVRMVARVHARLVYRPWLPHARTLMEVRHREGFGVFHLSRLGRGVASPGARLRLLWELIRRPRHVIDRSFWPASMLHACGGRPLVHGYALFRRLRDRTS